MCAWLLPRTKIFPALADTGKFRSDLLDRLAFDVLTLPPLREREEDIQLLAEHFAVDMAKELGREYFAGFSNEVSDMLRDYNWPGNIRELKNVVERCVYRTEQEDAVTEIIFDPFASPFRPLETKTAAAEITSLQKDDLGFPLDLKQHIKDTETDLIDAAMAEAKHNQRKAAEFLGLTYHQFRGYLKKYNLVGMSGEDDAA